MSTAAEVNRMIRERITALTADERADAATWEALAGTFAYWQSFTSEQGKRARRRLELDAHPRLPLVEHRLEPWPGAAP